jgi:PAS domain S-box-containing protein
LLLGLMTLTLFHTLSDILQWSGVTNALDEFEDYFELLRPAVWFFLAYTVLRERAAEALRASEERYRTLAEETPVLICSFLPGGEITYVNEGYCRYFAKTSEELVGSSFLSLMPEADREAVMAGISTMTVDSPNQSHEHRATSSSGEIRWQRWINRAQFDANGRPVAYQSIGEDITERKQAEMERERLMSAIEQAAEAIVITDVDATIQYVNPAFEQITGYPRGEAIGRNSRVLKSGEHDDAFYKELWGTLTRGEAWSGRFINKKKDGSLYTEEAVISPVRDASGVIANYVAVKRDITHEITLEDQLRQAQKMEAVGQLAGGIAHDFNNLLQVIDGYSALAMESLEQEHVAHGYAAQIAKAGQRAGTLIKQLLAFSRRQLIHPIDLDLNEVIDSLLEMVRRLIGEHIDLDFLSGNGLGTINVDRGQMEQVLMNLCVNARDAMPEGGKLIIETENVLVDGEYVRTHSWAVPGRYVLLSITDTGSGMESEQIGHIFEPFFTTKGKGEGTGLGLATVYGIIKQHHGYIHVYSEVDKGTMFKIYLPIVERRAAEVASSITGAAIGGTETILVAEDDEAVLKLCTRILRNAGYSVLTAEDGEEAVRMFEDHADEIDLVLVDVVMPKLGGKEAVARILKQRPDMRHLYASGYSENAVHTNFVQKRGLQLIGKPYQPEALLRAVREALDK